MSSATTLFEPLPGERWRNLRSRVWTCLCLLCALLVLIPLVSIFLYVVSRGAAGLSVGSGL